MRNTVTFHYPESSVFLSDADGVLAVEGARWFIELLKKVPGLEVDPELVQEDWGVAVLARRAGRSFWVGLSAMGDHEWIAHVHHGSFAWLQRLSSGGKEARASLVRDVDRILRGANASGLNWFDERDLNLGTPAPSPAED